MALLRSECHQITLTKLRTRSLLKSCRVPDDVSVQVHIASELLTIPITFMHRTSFSVFKRGVIVITSEMFVKSLENKNKLNNDGTNMFYRKERGI